MIFALSYSLTADSPLYPNTPRPEVRTLRSLDRGDSATTSTITFSTHAGTHVDVPRHFCPGGAGVQDLIPGPVSFFPAHCLDLHLAESREIGIPDLQAAIPQVRDAGALVVRTGWGTVRAGDPGRYTTDHPWISPDLPQFLRDACPRLRLFGLDQVSVSSPLHREAGHACHRSFLCGGRPVLLLEDLDLSDRRLAGPFRLHLFPCFTGALDGVPVTVIAER